MYSVGDMAHNSIICRFTISSGNNEWKQISGSKNHDIIYPLNGTHTFVTSYDINVMKEEMVLFDWGLTSAQWGKFRPCKISLIISI